MSAVTPWHPEDIKAAVRKRGVTLDELSVRAGLPKGACRAALRLGHRAGEAAIAAFLGVRGADLWPNRYETETGLRMKFAPRGPKKPPKWRRRKQPTP